ncbi:hypothetical protein [Piscirickettsia salmonis]|uniref:hypothetical protein n=1 Tax=Piscirickettsia salmonis TaxID=1238 RepID=UPI0007C938BB|nr:hypothetical protein A0O36_01480 [Piscirickettsiaceae bacterium NZ-RLO1]
MLLKLTEKFIRLDEVVVTDIPLNDTTLYGEKPAYYSPSNPDKECFPRAKRQIILLLDKIISENPNALIKLIELKDNLIKLETTGINHN